MKNDTKVVSIAVERQFSATDWRLWSISVGNGFRHALNWQILALNLKCFHFMGHLNQRNKGFTMKLFLKRLFFWKNLPTAAALSLPSSIFLPKAPAQNCCPIAPLKRKMLFLGLKQTLRSSTILGLLDTFKLGLSSVF